MICWLCAALFERLEYCEANKLVRVGELVRDALAEHGREPHEESIFNAKGQGDEDVRILNYAESE